MPVKPVFFVLTSHDELGDTGKPTGFHFEEMSTPYYVLRDAGIDVTLASIEGGVPDADPASVDVIDRDKNAASVNRFLEDSEAQRRLERTFAVADVTMDHYSAIYMPGGHGAMWDFPDNEALQALILDAYAQGKPVTAVCHGPAAFVNLKRHGKPLVAGVKLSSFTDDEERAGGKDGAMPFLLETRLRACGADFKKAPKGQAICVQDGLFITGQNPASAKPVAEALRDKLLARAHRAAA